MTSVAASSDELRLAVGTVAGSLGVLDMCTHKYTNWITSHEAAITALAQSHDGKEIATGSKDGTIRIWDMGTGKQSFEFTASGAHRTASLLRFRLLVSSYSHGSFCGCWTQRMNRQL